MLVAVVVIVAVVVVVVVGGHERRSIVLESVLFGALKQSVVFRSMSGSDATRDAIESMVRDMRSCMVESAYAIWNISTIRDNDSPLPIPLSAPTN